MAKRKTYDDEFRAGAVLLLEAAGWPDKEGAIAQVAKRVGVPANTLSRWARGKNNPPPAKVVDRKKVDLIDAIRAEIASALEHMNDVRPDASYRDTGTVFGILTDKLQLLNGEATESVQQTITFEWARAEPSADED